MCAYYPPERSYPKALRLPRLGATTYPLVFRELVTRRHNAIRQAG